MSDTFAAIQTLARKLEKQHCLIIADDLTGGADAGAQFAKRGMKTLQVSYRGEGSVPLAARPAQDVLVINTITRGLPSAEAFDILSGLLKSFDPKPFPILYKKIDSTLRGNIGAEIDATLADSTYPSDYWKKMRKRDPDLGKALQRGGNLSPFALEFATVGRTYKATHRMLPSYRSKFLSKRVIQKNPGSCFGSPLSGTAIH